MFTHHHPTNNQSTAVHGQGNNATGEGTSQHERGICSAARLAAELYAIRKADNYGIPQTVFRNTHADMWQHTNPFPAIFIGAKTAISSCHQNT